MFERYTERARRTLFFARYEASQRGSTSIDAEDILLGLLRESKGVTGIIFSRAHLRLDDVAPEVYRRSPPSKKVSTSVEIPFSAAAKQVLIHAAEEADGLSDRFIGAEHLLLGLLREDGSVVASILRDHGLRLEPLRAEIPEITRAESQEPAAGRPPDDLRAQIDRMKVLLSHLRQELPDSEDARRLADEIQERLERLKKLLGE